MNNLLLNLGLQLIPIYLFCFWRWIGRPLIYSSKIIIGRQTINRKKHNCNLFFFCLIMKSYIQANCPIHNKGTWCVASKYKPQWYSLIKDSTKLISLWSIAPYKMKTEAYIYRSMFAYQMAFEAFWDLYLCR